MEMETIILIDWYTGYVMLSANLLFSLSYMVPMY